jgi:hypothetical protein
MSTINTSDFNAAVDAVKWTVVMFFRCWNPIMFGLGIVGHSLSILFLHDLHSDQIHVEDTFWRQAYPVFVLLLVFFRYVIFNMATT